MFPTICSRVSEKLAFHLAGLEGNLGRTSVISLSGLTPNQKHKVHVPVQIRANAWQAYVEALVPRWRLPYFFRTTLCATPTIHKRLRDYAAPFENYCTAYKDSKVKQIKRSTWTMTAVHQQQEEQHNRSRVFMEEEPSRIIHLLTKHMTINLYGAPFSEESSWGKTRRIVARRVLPWCSTGATHERDSMLFGK